MARATSGPYSADPNDEVCGVGEAFWFDLLGYGSKHRLQHNYSEGSTHVLKGERLAMQSHQVPALARRTDRQCIHRLHEQYNDRGHSSLSL